MADVMYQLAESGVIRLSDQAFIPDCNDNRDWQAYQQWLSEGNKPLPMHPPPINNAIYIANGQARQQRIQREQQQQAAAELLKLKQQVAALTA